MGIRKRFGILALCALAGSTVSLVAPQHAAAAELDSVTVSYRGLQLSNPADVRVLYKRLQRAARTVCVEPSRYELERYAEFQHCVRVLMRDAIARIHSPELDRTLAELNRTTGEYSLTAQAGR